MTGCFTSPSLTRAWRGVEIVVLRSKNRGSVLTHSKAVEARGTSSFVRGASNEGLGTLKGGLGIQDEGLLLGVRANQTIGTPRTPASLIAAFSSLEWAKVDSTDRCNAL